MKPHPHPRVFLIRIVYLVLPLAALLTSLEARADYGPNEWWIVDSDDRPPTLTQNGMLWLPRHMTNGRWFYFPQPLCVLIDRGSGGEMAGVSEVTLIVDGRRWVMVASNENWTFIPPWEKSVEDIKQETIEAQVEVADHGRDSAQAWTFTLVSVAIVVGALATWVAYQVGTAAGSTNSDEELSENLAQREGAIKEREGELRRALATNTRWREEAEAEFNQARANLQTQEVELGERRQRELVSLRNAEAMLRGDANCPAAIGQYLRKQHLRGAVLGDLVTSTFLADRSGFIRIAWKVQIDRPQPPTVRLLRDGKTIHSDASLAGEHGDHIVPGRRYVYAITLIDDKGRSIGKGGEFEMKIPTEAVWNKDLGGDDNERQRKIREQFMSRFNGFRVTEELKQECYSEVKAKSYPKEVEEWLLSKIDAMASQLAEGT
jgi:hypothetical protein